MEVDLVRALRRFRPSPAFVLASIALTVALGGTSYAAVQRLPRNSVTTFQVKDFSLLSRDFKRGQIPAGPVGPTGPTGPTGPAGPAGPAGTSNIKWALVKGDGTILQQSGGIEVQSHTTGTYIVDFNSGALNGKLIVVSPAQANSDTGSRGTVSAGPCGGTPEGSNCSVRNDTTHVRVQTYSSGGALANHAFYVALM
jgi:hypothetical protein